MNTENTTPKPVQDLLDKMAEKNNVIDLDAYAWGLQHMYEHMVNRPLTVLAPPVEWGEWAEYGNPQDRQYRYSMDGKYMMDRNGKHFSTRLFMQHFGGTEEEVVAFIQADAQNAINHAIKGCKIVVKQEA